MAIKSGNYVLYGLRNLNLIIEEIIKFLKVYGYSFDITLILTEAVSNAFIHGNNGDVNKPIKLSYYYDGTTVRFEIKSTEKNLNYLYIPDEISDDDLLDCHGKGLFLIKCYSDKIEIKNSTLVITKNLYCGGKTK